MERRDRQKRFTAPKQNFTFMKRSTDLNRGFVSHQPDVEIMDCRMDLNEHLGTNDMGFQLPRKVVLLGA